MLAKLREFINCRTGISWDQLRAAGDEYALTVSKAWASPRAPAESTGILQEVKTPGPLYIDGDVLVGTGSRQFCEAVKTLIDEGSLQVLVGGVMQFAIDPATDYGYGSGREAPTLPGLKATITTLERAPF